jgi:hypothetical protein
MSLEMSMGMGGGSAVQGWSLTGKVRQPKVVQRLGHLGYCMAWRMSPIRGAIGNAIQPRPCRSFLRFE